MKINNKEEKALITLGGRDISFVNKFFSLLYVIIFNSEELFSHSKLIILSMVNFGANEISKIIVQYFSSCNFWIYGAMFQQL